MTLVALCAVAGAGLASTSWYRQHVESEFATFIAQHEHREPVKILEPRCLGKEVTSIRLWPIVGSKLLGSYPYLDEIVAPRERAYMEFAYWHGYSFNYCKPVVRDGEDLTAYWSLKEDLWHLVRRKTGRVRWEEVTE